MEYIFIVGAVQAIFFAVLAFNKQIKSRGDHIMIGWFVLLAIMLMAYALEVIGIEDQYPVLWALSTCLPLLTGPVTYLYVLAFTQGDKKINPLFLLHTLPYVIFTVFVFIKMFVNPEPTVREDITLIEDGGQLVFSLMGFARILLGPIYLIFGLWLLKKHQVRIGRYFSYTEDINLKWLRHVLLMTVLIWITVIIMSILSNWNDFIPWRLGDNLIYLVVTITVFANGYYGIRQQIIFSPSTVKSDAKITAPLPEKSKSQYSKSGLTEKESKDHLQKLLQFMEEEKPYLDGKLSLAQVAKNLEISTNHLSQVINENLNRNFFDFVNRYRVEMVKKKMLDPKNKNRTLLGIAYDSGFNSKSSFNSIFKNSTSMTPSQFLKQQSVKT